MLPNHIETLIYQKKAEICVFNVNKEIKKIKPFYFSFRNTAKQDHLLKLLNPNCTICVSFIHKINNCTMYCLLCGDFQKETKQYFFECKCGKSMSKLTAPRYYTKKMLVPSYSDYLISCYYVIFLTIILVLSLKLTNYLCFSIIILFPLVLAISTVTIYKLGMMYPKNEYLNLLWWLTFYDAWYYYFT